MHNHRVACAAAGCGRVWRENCRDCAEDTANRHRRLTGHPVELRITEARDWNELREMTGMAHRVLMMRGQRRGW